MSEDLAFRLFVIAVLGGLAAVTVGIVVVAAILIRRNRTRD
jgi:hypothetical protein